MFGWRKTFEAARFRDFLSGPLKSIRAEATSFATDWRLLGILAGWWATRK